MKCPHIVLFDCEKRELVDIPEGTKQWKIKARPNCFAIIILRHGPNKTERRALESVGDDKMRPLMDFVLGQNLHGKKVTYR